MVYFRTSAVLVLACLLALTLPFQQKSVSAYPDADVANPGIFQMWCDLCQTVTTSLGQQAVLFGSQTLSRSEAATAYCTTVTLIDQKACTEFILGVGGRIGYGMKTIGEFSDTFCLLNPACEATGNPSADPSQVIYPEAILSCMQCQREVAELVGDTKLVENEVIVSASTTVCNAFVEGDGKETETCIAKLGWAAIKEMVYDVTMKPVLETNKICMYLDKCTPDMQQAISKVKSLRAT